MRNIIIFNGSPRKKGNTNILAEYLIKNLQEEKTDVAYLYNYNIEPCTDCCACKEGDLECIVDDGMQELYKKMEQSDVIVFGTPIYWYGVTAKTKLLLDRFRPYFRNKKLKGKKAALLLPAGSGEGDCDLTIEMFKRMCNALEMQLLGFVTSESYDIGDAHKDKKALKDIEALSKKIAEA